MNQEGAKFGTTLYIGYLIGARGGTFGVFGNLLGAAIEIGGLLSIIILVISFFRRKKTTEKNDLNRQ